MGLDLLLDGLEGLGRNEAGEENKNKQKKERLGKK
jgi:hypothetical protein